MKSLKSWSNRCNRSSRRTKNEPTVVTSPFTQILSKSTATQLDGFALKTLYQSASYHSFSTYLVEQLDFTKLTGGTAKASDDLLWIILVYLPPSTEYLGQASTSKGKCVSLAFISIGEEDSSGEIHRRIPPDRLSDSFSECLAVERRDPSTLEDLSRAISSVVEMRSFSTSSAHHCHHQTRGRNDDDCGSSDLQDGFRRVVQIPTEGVRRTAGSSFDVSSRIISNARSTASWTGRQVSRRTLLSIDLRTMFIASRSVRSSLSDV